MIYAQWTILLLVLMSNAMTLYEFGREGKVGQAITFAFLSASIFYVYIVAGTFSLIF